jgi:spore coat protein U-like protein
MRLKKEQHMNKNIATKQQSLKLALIAFALGAATVSGGASAANNATATATATVVTPISITKATDLSFGSFYPGASSGTVDVNTNGTRGATGGVVTSALGVPAAAAKFDVVGQNSATYTIAYASGVTLTGPGAPMALTQVSDLTGAGGAATLVAAGALSGAGTQSIYIGGSLAVAANQVSGAYTGTISATVNYN